MKLEKGDLVKITDGSHAVRVGANFGFGSDCIGLSTKHFQVIMVDPSFDIRHGMHDIIIKNPENNNVYLHSSNFVKKIPRTYKIKIDGIEIELSEESYKLLKKSLLK